MADLTTYTRANKEFFAKGAGPSAAKWRNWIDRGVVRGKLIDGEPWIDANWFAANDVMEEPAPAVGMSGLDLYR